MDCIGATVSLHQLQSLRRHYIPMGIYVPLHYFLEQNLYVANAQKVWKSNLWRAALPVMDHLGADSATDAMLLHVALTLL